MPIDLNCLNQLRIRCGNRFNSIHVSWYLKGEFCDLGFDTAVTKLKNDPSNRKRWFKFTFSRVKWQFACANVNEILKMPIDLNCLNQDLLTKLSEMLSVDDLEVLCLAYFRFSPYYFVAAAE